MKNATATNDTAAVPALSTPSRTRGPALFVSVIGLAAALVGCSESTDPVVEQPTNADIAEEVVTQLARGNAGVITARFQSGFVDHETANDGTAALSEQVAATHAAHPDADSRLYRVISEGDLVFVHSQLVLDPGTRGFAVADIFRFEGGKIAEHWGDRQEVPATTASGNDMFSTLSAPQRLDPDPKADPAKAREVMAALGTALIVDKDLSAWDRYVKPPYYQHSINTPNGAEAVKEVWGPIVADPSVMITPVTSLAEGDLFVTMNLIDSPALHLTTVDVSRIRDGLIVEHWDVVQAR